MDNKNDVTKTMILISHEKERKVMTEPSDDEILAAQGLLELSQVTRRFYDNIKPTNTIDAINPFPPISTNRNEFSNYQRLPTYMPIATLPAISVNPIDGETEPKSSPTYPTYSPYAVPINQMIPINPSARWEKQQTLPPLLPYISSHLASSSLEEEEDTQFVMGKKEEREGDKERNDDGELKITKKRKFYINQTSKQREADISYHRKKLDVHMKMVKYRSD